MIDEPDAEDGPDGDPEIDQLTYDFASWAGESRALLGSLLDGEDLSHAWQGTTLMVHSSDESRIDELVESVNSVAAGALDRERERVVYEVGSWSAAMQTSLVESLTVAGISYEWDENGDVVVYGDDEERVEEIFDAMPDPDDPDVTEGDGLDVTETLFRLWVAAGDLAKRSDDAAAVLSAIEASSQLETMALPFGFESAVWRDICGKATALRAALDSDDPDDALTDEELMVGCRALHDQLRQFV